MSVDVGRLGWVDRLVAEGVYESRSAAMEAAMDALHRQRMDDQFERALAATTPEVVAEEQALADEGLAEWFAQLDEEDGGWASEGDQHAAG